MTRTARRPRPLFTFPAIAGAPQDTWLATLPTADAGFPRWTRRAA